LAVEEGRRKDRSAPDELPDGQTYLKSASRESRRVRVFAASLEERIRRICREVFREELDRWLSEGMAKLAAMEAADAK
jgi:hypothetical protein